MKYKTIKTNYKEIDKCIKYIKNTLNEYYIKEYTINDYKNIIISNYDTNDFDIIFCGHIDVVPDKNYDNKIIDGKLYGRGSADMKSQVATMMALFKNLKTKKKVALLITSDEEIGGYCCKEILKNYNSKLAIVPDGGTNFNLIVEEKGLLQVKITALGKSFHSSEPFNGINAIEKLINYYDKLIKIFPKSTKDEFKTTVNLSLINGGDTYNKVPDNASMVLDIRFNNDYNYDKLIKILNSIDKSLKVEVLDYGPTFSCDTNNKYIIEFIKNSNNILGRKINMVKACSTGDSIYFSEKNIPTIMINPEVYNLHSDNEYIVIKSLEKLYELFKSLI